MTTPIQYPLLNGRRHSFCSVELKLNNVIFKGFKKIDYKRTRERTDVYGNHPDPLGKTHGTNKYEASCELYLAEWNLFQATLGAGYGDVPFQIDVTYTENGFDMIHDTLMGCTLDSSEATNAQGNEGTSRPIELHPVKILFNGLDDVDQPLSGVTT